MKATVITPFGESEEIEATLFDHPTHYGNGKAMAIKLRDHVWKTIDCRYIIDFDARKVFESVLRENFDKYTIHD